MILSNEPDRKALGEAIMANVVRFQFDTEGNGAVVVDSQSFDIPSRLLPAGLEDPTVKNYYREMVMGICRTAFKDAFEDTAFLNDLGELEDQSSGSITSVSPEEKDALYTLHFTFEEDKRQKADSTGNRFSKIQRDFISLITIKIRGAVEAIISSAELMEEIHRCVIEAITPDEYSIAFKMLLNPSLEKKYGVFIMRGILGQLAAQDETFKDVAIAFKREPAAASASIVAYVKNEIQLHYIDPERQRLYPWEVLESALAKGFALHKSYKINHFVLPPEAAQEDVDNTLPWALPLTAFTADLITKVHDMRVKFKIVPRIRDTEIMATSPMHEVLSDAPAAAPPEAGHDEPALAMTSMGDAVDLKVLTPATLAAVEQSLAPVAKDGKRTLVPGGAVPPPEAPQMILAQAPPPRMPDPSPAETPAAAPLAAPPSSQPQPKQKKAPPGPETAARMHIAVLRKAVLGAFLGAPKLERKDLNRPPWMRTLARVCTWIVKQLKWIAQ